MNLDFLKNKKIFVAGGAGLLGTNLTKYLVDHEIKVKSSHFSRKPSESLKAHYQQYDFTRYSDCLAATREQDYVILCAVQSSGVVGMRQSPTASILPNLEIYAGLLEACNQNRVKKVVWVSSSTVYQEAFYPIREDQLDLNRPPYELYQGVAWVYRYLEQLAKFYHEKQGLAVGIIRTTNIYGPYDRFEDEKSHVIPALMKRALKKESPFVVWGNGETVRDFVYVDDLVQGVLEVLAEYCIAEPINFSQGAPTQIKELVEKTLKVCRHAVQPHYDFDKPTAVPYRVLDNNKFNTLLGNIERTPLEKGLQKTVEWYTSSQSRE